MNQSEPPREKKPFKFRIGKLVLFPDGREIEVANTNDLVIIPGLEKLNPYAILRTEL